MSPEISIGSATSAAITGDTTPEDFIRDIQSGRWAKQVAAVRAATGDEAALLKRKLPAVLWGGTFSGRSNKGLIQRSGLICADIDKIPERVGELHDIARNDPHAIAAFVSPSGTGLKIVFRADDFAAVRSHVATHYKAQVDEAAKDVARLCFVSHDPAAFYNADAVPLELPAHDVAPETPEAMSAANDEPSSRALIAENLLGAIQWTDEGGFCKCPGEHLHTSANGRKDCKVMLSGVPTIKCFHASCRGIVDGVNHELRSRIGKAERQTAPDANYSDAASEYLGEGADEAQPSLIERLETRIYSPQVKPVEPSPRLFLAGVQVSTAGNLTTISAKPKDGKSAAVGAMIGSTFAASDADCLGFTSENPNGFAVVHIDTEQTPFDHWDGIQRNQRRAKVDTVPAWLRSYCLTGFPAADVRLAIRILTAQAAKQFGGVHSVFIDGIADAVNDVNDPAETSSLITELHKLAIEFDCPILNIVHLNPGSDFKTRGHLGSQLERKSETNLRLEKDDAGATVIWADKNRRAPIPKATAPRFAWCDDAGMHVSVATQRSAKDDAEKQAMQIEAEAVFSAAKNAVISYGQFITFLMREVHASKSTAKRRFGQMLRTQIIRKELTGFYTLNA